MSINLLGNLTETQRQYIHIQHILNLSMIITLFKHLFAQAEAFFFTTAIIRHLALWRNRRQWNDSGPDSAGIHMSEHSH